MISMTKKPTWWSIAAIPVSVAVVMTPVVLMAAGGYGQGFDSVVRGIEQRYHVHANRIPFMGLVNGIARISTHGGVHNLHVAEIEHVDANVNGDELLALVEERAGEGWKRMIRETSREGHEQTLIFVRAEGKQVGMLVVDLESREMDVVQISMNPDQLMDQVNEHRSHGGSDADRDGSGKGESGKGESGKKDDGE